ncbi:PilZ domain-containing protein [Pseudomonas duriflava]|uniref:PilZ domain-containing protein n=1 Tax=Pseudomonas duriflava TaxID=459528 RepID=A0A562QNU9_9PSED|nr:PilZ domain-containing protein [Pseudomonas duriflava]TWI58429.1 PilZ domain-containing protein [Pseudomonas duriflava]
MDRNGTSAPCTPDIETQRQHPRVRVPARIRYQGAHREGMEHQLTDLSAGGFSFTSRGVTVHTNDFLKGKLLFAIDRLSFAIDVNFEIKSIDRDTGRVGCAFHNLATRELSALRYLIEAYRAGDMVTMGDMISSVSLASGNTRFNAGLVKSIDASGAIIEGRFEIHQYAHVQPGQRVEFKLITEQTLYSARIVDTKVESCGTTYVVVALLQADSPLPIELNGQPVQILLPL